MIGIKGFEEQWSLGQVVFYICIFVDWMLVGMFVLVVVSFNIRFEMGVGCLFCFSFDGLFIY